nr:MAG TPA: ssDNA binding protein [Caudoviricetes sp.]
MKIIKSFPENLTMKQAYSLTRNPDSRPMKTLEGATFNIGAYAIYEDVNSKGETQEVLAVLTIEGDTFSTISATFKRDFEAIVDMANLYGADLATVDIEVFGGESKQGRHYIGCKMN